MGRSIFETGSTPESGTAVRSCRPGHPASPASSQAGEDRKPHGSRAPSFIKRSTSLHLIWRIGVFLVGFAVTVTGVILLPLPGPGWVVIFGGMAIWATEFTWAQVTMRWTKLKVSEVVRRVWRPGGRRRHIVLTSPALAVVTLAVAILITHLGRSVICATAPLVAGRCEIGPDGQGQNGHT
ncbi:TIGR02611 family protein [Streptomyces sp. NBC_00687]|uniref:TIGR02611 family protein n=1 Tax=Streptomyces sp. NBC_00687 TaxID=2975807 RepID=UPI002B1D1012|nr:TIGR02611 family protein [Streptomyces sp. NBC_00687]